MKLTKTLVILAKLSLILSLVSCSNTITSDTSTFSNYNQVKQTSLDLDLFINFEKQILSGSAELSLTFTENGVFQVILDSSSLLIHSITDDQGNTLKYRVQEIKNSVLGNPLEVYLVRLFNKGEEIKLRIEYETTANSQSIQWLTPEMTFGKQFPYMFSQNEPIYARSMVPCQDTPSHKIPVKARLTVREDLVALFGGNLVENEDKDSNNKYSNNSDNGSNSKKQSLKTFTYLQAIPIPTYLIAIAAGNIVSRQITKKIAVYSEPEKIQAVYDEFAQSGNYFDKAEEYMFAYEWGNYNILVLPPAFPYGGMENPNLTFATPSLIAGDRSLVNVIAHELAHSWTGNLVTNSNWDSFWLNEGFTVFFERKLIQLVFDEDTRMLQSQIGYSGFLRDLDTYPVGSTYTSLNPRIGNNNPDDAFSTVPYEKGYNFLFFLETMLGEAVFKDFFVGYIRKFSKSSVTTQDFRETFEEFVRSRFVEEKAGEIFGKIDWEAWINTPGEPPVKNNFESKQANTVIKDLESILNNDTPKDFVNTFKAWSSTQKELFLGKLLQNSSKITDKIVSYVKNDLQVYKNNMEVQFLWLSIELTLKDRTILPLVDEFLVSIGRMKFVRPTYNLLYKLDKEYAIKSFENNKKLYHPILVNLINKDFNIKEEKKSFLKVDK